MRYTLLEDEPETSEKTSQRYTILEDEPEVKEEKKQRNDTEGSTIYGLASSFIRGVGTTAANLSEAPNTSSKRVNEQFSPNQSPNAAEEGQALAKRIRENLPDESDTAVGRGVERAGKYLSNPVSLAFGVPGLIGSTVAGFAGQAVEEVGGGPGLQTAAEIGANAVGLAKVIYEAGKNVIPAVAQKVGGVFAKAEVKAAPAQIEQRLQSAAKEGIQRLEVATAENAKPFKRGEFNGKEIAQEFENSTVNRELNQIAPKIATEKDFGKAVQDTLNAEFVAAEARIKPLYDVIEEKIAPGVKTSSKPVIDYIEKIEEKLSSLKTKPENYGTVQKALRAAKQDLGYDPVNKVYREVPLTQNIELGRRLNKIIDYDLAEKSIKDTLKGVRYEVKQGIRNDLKKVDPIYEEIFDTAEKMYGETANKFARKSIRSIRGTQASEKVAAVIDQPSTLQDLKNILKPAEYAVVERQVLEKINKMSPAKAAETLKEVTPYLSKNAETAGQNIVSFKDPQYFNGKWNKYANSIVDELQEAFTAGERPSKTLKLMQTRDGYKTVYETLHTTEAGRKSLKYLQKQYIDDMVSSALKKDGSLDWSKLGEIVTSNETNKLILRQSLGKKGLVEFEKFAEYGRNIAENFKRYGPAVDKTGMKNILKNHSGKIALPLVGLISGGLPFAAAGASAAAAGSLSMYLTRRMLASPTTQAAFKELANPKTWEKGNAEKVAQSLLLQAAKSP